MKDHLSIAEDNTMVMFSISGVISILGLITVYAQIGVALRMAYSPQPFNHLIHSRLDIACVSDGSFTQDVVVLQIQKPGKEPLAVIDAKHGLTTGHDGRSNIQAAGHLNSDAENSNLTVSINKPAVGDAGTYECVMFYLDSTYLLKEVRTSVVVTMDNENISANVSHFVETLQEHAKQLQLLQEENNKQSAIIQDQERQLKNLKAQVSYQCAFSMRYKAGDKVIVGQNLLFTDPILNLGNAYNVTTGIFTAPRHGVYVFHLTIENTLIHGYSEIGIWKNQDRLTIVFAQDGNYWDQSSSSVSVELQPGDTIRLPVRGNTGGDKIYPVGSVFSGYLLSLI